MFAKGSTVMKATGIVPIDDIPREVKDVPLDELADVYRVCLEMQTLCELHSGIGLAAVQAGIPWKLFIIKSDGTNPFVPKNEYGYFINCRYEAATNSEPVVSLEGCLSVRSKTGQLRYFEVLRSNNIHFFGLRLYFDKELKCESIDRKIGLAEQGIVFQHEIDHARQILISDIGKEVFLW